MFGLTEIFYLILSAFIILPVVIFMRELGYIIAGSVVGAENPRITIGSGPRLFKIGIIDVRKHYHLLSWFSYDELRIKSKPAYILLYASPILINIFMGLLINFLIANGFIESYPQFWDRLLFYLFYYVLLDSIPMEMAYGRPNNGMLIYEIIRYGKRVDPNNEAFIPKTVDVEDEYQKSMEKLHKK